MKLYHLTPKNNVEQIKKEGLKINKKQYASINENDGIYLTSSIKKLLQQEGEWNNDIAIFEIDNIFLLGLTLLVDWELVYDECDSPFSFYTPENIPSNKIKLIGEINNRKTIMY